MLKCHYKRVNSFCRHCRWWYLHEGALIHTRILVISTVCIGTLEEEKEKVRTSQFLSALMLLPLPCNTKRQAQKHRCFSQNALCKMQELHLIELSPNSHVLDHAMHRSLKEQFKPRQLCHFPSLSSPVCMFRWGKRQQTEQICL